MPLSQQLKSDMTCNPAEGTPKNELDPSGMEPLDISDNLPQAQDMIPVQSDLLKSIENQLRLLSNSVSDLNQSISGSTNIDFGSVFAKIDSARISIENLITSQTAAEPDIDTQKVLTLFQSIIEKQEKNDRQLTQTLRENATFQIQVRQGMQQDIDSLKEQIDGEQFNPLLREIASVYVEYQTLLDDESISNLSRKNLCALFEQLEDILSDYDAEVCRSEIGSVRRTRTCKIIGKIPTGNQEKHNTIAASRKPGVIRGRSVLYPELVDVFVYDSELNVTEAVHNLQEEGDTETSVPETTVDSTDKPDSQNILGGNE